MKKMLFIYNIHSGKGNIKNNLAGIIDIFNKADYEVTAYSTQQTKDATRLAREYGTQYDVIVCSGGDGTLSEVLDGIMCIDEEKRPNIGYIPAGSTNDYAYSLGLPDSMSRCAHVIAEGNFRKVDVGRFNGGDHFVYVAAFGAFTEVSWNTPQKEKNALGHNAYILNGIKQFSGLKSYNVRFQFDGQEIAGSCIYAMVYNALSVGGFRNISGTEVNLDDGKLNLMIVYTPENAVEFSIMIADLMMKNQNSKYIVNYEIEKVSVESDNELTWVLDGEYGGAHKAVTIEAISHAMSIAVPADVKG